MSYKGKITIVGSSGAIRVEKALFKQHPEFKQQSEVKTHVIGPGMLLIALEDATTQKQDSDPLVDAFLSFLEADTGRNIASVSAALDRAKAATDGVTFTEEDFE